MATTSPARIDDDLYASAKLAGEVQSRSASQQVVHWARIGREIEASSSVSHKDIGRVLAGSRSYDSVSVKEQAVIRAEWSARIDALRDGLNLAEQFATAGRTWVELDDDGTIVERGDTRGGGGEEPPRRGKPASTANRRTAVKVVVESGAADRVIAKSAKRTAVGKQDKTPGRRAGSSSSG